MTINKYSVSKKIDSRLAKYFLSLLVNMKNSSENRIRILGAKFKEAGSSGNKVHVMSQQGHWVVFRENSKRILYKYPDKQTAIQSGKRILDSGKSYALVIHRTDGSVERFQTAG